MDKVKELPISFGVALGSKEEIAEGHPSKEHPYSMGFIGINSAQL